MTGAYGLVTWALVTTAPAKSATIILCGGFGAQNILLERPASRTAGERGIAGLSG